jgi:hypothetical protein
MVANCRAFTHSVAGGSWLGEGPVNDSRHRIWELGCVFLVLDGTNLDT